MTSPTVDEVRSRLEATARRVSNWGRFGPDDEAGTVNYIDEAKRRDASALVRSGRALSLALPLERAGPQPPFERRLNPQLQMLDTGTDIRAGRQAGAADGWGYADDMVTMALQCATHWDALSHVFYDYRMYNDRDCDLVSSEGAAKNDVAVFRDRVVTRGVLLDVPRATGADPLPPGHEIGTAELEATLEHQRVEVGRGDALLIRTGHMGGFRSTGSWDGYTHAAAPGLGLDVAVWLHEREIAAVAADTWCVEVVAPGLLPGAIPLPWHAVAIVHMGLLVGENFLLDDLAAESARDGVYEFLFVAPPLPFGGAVGGPTNPIVIK
jgi:kynurenine formamidase